jgi:dTDP-glucose 4,6-dehydratase
VTGGAGFIGSSVVRLLLDEGDVAVVSVDKLTYASAGRSLEPHERHCLEIADIADRRLLRDIFTRHCPDAVMHLAAETHVDRSIDCPDDFIATNLVGTFNLLEVVREYWQGLPVEKRKPFRFHHVSTDEVFGSLGQEGSCTEAACYRPNSPYAASKAGADHLARAWHCTFGLPVVTTYCSNNYGPWQFPEKLVPLMILNALEGKELPVYGHGANVRDWLYVEDHARALLLVLRHGRVGETYNVAGGEQRSNIELVREICAILDDKLSDSKHRPHEQLIRFVADRPGHDLRYALNDNKLRSELGWKPRECLAGGLRKTVRWYLDNQKWWEPIRIAKYGGERLGRWPAPPDKRRNAVAPL